MHSYLITIQYTNVAILFNLIKLKRITPLGTIPSMLNKSRTKQRKAVTSWVASHLLVVYEVECYLLLKLILLLQLLRVLIHFGEKI